MNSFAPWAAFAVAAASLASPSSVAADAWPSALGYVLQAEGLADDRAGVVRRLAASRRDLLVLDAAFAAGGGGAWTREELDAIRAGAPRRRVVSYLSIGEAEAYRDYFDALPDGLLLDENPDWPGNFKVRYWRDEWQRLIASRAAALIEQGFDGVYLDIVDAYQHFEHDSDGGFHPGRVNPDTGTSYRAAMARFVARIAGAVRAVHPGALVIPQNGSDLLRDDAFRATVDGIGLEDLFTLGDERQEPAHTRQVLDNVAVLDGTRHFVLDIEYADTARGRAYAVERAGELDFVLLLTDRALKTLGTSYAPMRWR